MMIIKLRNIWQNFDGPVFFKPYVDLIAILLIFFVGLYLAAAFGNLSRKH